MDAILLIDEQLAKLQSVEAQIKLLKMQRKVLIDAQKEQKLDELEAKLYEPTAKPVPRKPRTSGVKDAVLAIIEMRSGPHGGGIKSADIIAELSHIESGSIRQALNGLKKKGEIMQDGKMWVMAPTGISNGACVTEDLMA